MENPTIPPPISFHEGGGFGTVAEWEYGRFSARISRRSCARSTSVFFLEGREMSQVPRWLTSVVQNQSVPKRTIKAIQDREF